MRIQFINLNQEAPYIKIKKKYDKAVEENQQNIDAVAISSYSKNFDEVNSRFVNLKYIDNKEFIFFSNYKSKKSIEFKEHNQISALIYWNSINTQIRIKALIQKKSLKFNRLYFASRPKEKNALAISSNQSKPIESYQKILENYNKSLKFDNLQECPDYWGGYSFIPFYFEFWEGHDLRINKREVFEKTNGIWKHSFLQP